MSLPFKKTKIEQLMVVATREHRTSLLSGYYYILNLASVESCPGGQKSRQLDITK